MTKRCELSLNVARSNQRWHRPREAESAARVFAALIAGERRLAHPGHVGETERREAVRPRVLIIVFSKHCADQLQAGVFVRAQTVVRKEPRDDASEDQGDDAFCNRRRASSPGLRRSGH